MKWIDANNRLPKESGRYLVCTTNLTGYKPLEDTVFIATFAYDDWLFDGWEDNRVTHWMELPKNPNEISKRITSTR